MIFQLSPLRRKCYPLGHMNEPELVIPSGLFRHSPQTQRNDRYVVYHMLNRMVTFRDPSTGAKISGFVEEVYRDIFIGEVRLTVRGRAYKFKEPTSVRADDGAIMFFYGYGGHGLSDEKLFSEMRSGQFKETVGDTIRRVGPKKLRQIRFVLGGKKPSRRKPLLMRGITAELAVVSA